MANLPTLYEYYTGGGITSGLSADQSYFTLNDKNITLYSGAMHYFRVPQEYWRDRLRKMRAAGLNAVETYVPWNLHEPQPGVYDFGRGGTDYQDLLDIEKFLKIAQEEDLLAIVRPGPYICAEWEFGGMPSWLLREKGIRVRTSDELFMRHVRRYLAVLFSILTVFQFTKGGPVIAFQIENEYGNTKYGSEPLDTDYLVSLKNLFLENGAVELLFTSDNPSSGTEGQIPGILYAGNFQIMPEEYLELLQGFQPGKPLLVMEYWTGWYDMWMGAHSTKSDEEFSDVFRRIVQFPASVNMYMFLGGSNFGFLNGANVGFSTDNRGFNSVTSSYDYDAPLTEAGDYTVKYFSARAIIEANNDVKTRLPPLPGLTERIAYETVPVTGELLLTDLIDTEPTPFESVGVVPMELLPINNGAGQSYGYIVYRKQFIDIVANSVIKIGGRVCDTAMLLINGELKSKILRSKKDLSEFGYWQRANATLELGNEEYVNATLDIVVENWGRNNYGTLRQFSQFKGLWQGNVTINDQTVLNWQVYPLEFKKSWTNGLAGWKAPRYREGPVLYKATLNVQEPKDTFIDMRNWHKGIIMVNGFVLSRYLRLGPQQGVYLPAPFLRAGDNDIVIFEHFVPGSEVRFMSDQVFDQVATLP